MAEFIKATKCSPNQDDVAVKIQLSMAIVSLIGTGSTAVVMVISRSVRRREIFIHFQISLADALASIGIIVSSLLWNQQKHPQVQGYYVSVELAKTFYSATFGLIVSFALNVLSLLKKSRPLYYAVLAANIMSWILAMLYFALAVYDLEKALKSGSNGECCISVLYHHQNGCYELNWLKKTYVLYFLAAILTTFVALVIIYGSIYKHVKRRSFESVTPTTEERMEITHTMYRSILNCSAFALCWLPYFISELLEKHACFRTECPSYLQVLKIICFSSQGLVNSIVYGWSRTTFRKLRLSDAQLSSSLVFFTRYNRSNYNYMAISDTELESSCEHIK